MVELRVHEVGTRDEMLTAYAASTAVNSPRNELPALIEPLAT